MDKALLLDLFADNGLDHNITDLIKELITASQLHTSANQPNDELLTSTNQPLPQTKYTENLCNNFLEITVFCYTDSQFKENFCLNRPTFAALLKATHALVKTDELTLQKQLLFSLWMLGHQESYSAATKRFGMPESTGHDIFKSIIQILTKMLSRYVCWPTSDERRKTVKTYASQAGGMPDFVGAIDTCHFTIRQPAENAEAYLNNAQCHAIVLQAVCDSAGRFIDVFIGMPGGLSDEQVFRRSSLYKKLCDPEQTMMEPNQHLVGDAAYPPLLCLKVPLDGEDGLNITQKRYNSNLRHVHSSIEHALARLKAQFPRLCYLNLTDAGLAKDVVTACCMLHNFVLHKNGENAYLD